MLFASSASIPLLLQNSPLITEVENTSGESWLFLATFLPKFHILFAKILILACLFLKIVDELAKSVDPNQTLIWVRIFCFILSNMLVYGFY